MRADDHRMPVDDIRHAWSEKRTPFDDDGVGEGYVVFVGLCTCGRRFEGRDAREVTRDFGVHRELMLRIEEEV